MYSSISLIVIWFGGVFVLYGCSIMSVFRKTQLRMQQQKIETKTSTDNVFNKSSIQEYSSQYFYLVKWNKSSTVFIALCTKWTQPEYDLLPVYTSTHMPSVSQWSRDVHHQVCNYDDSLPKHWWNAHQDGKTSCFKPLFYKYPPTCGFGHLICTDAAGEAFWNILPRPLITLSGGPGSLAPVLGSLNCCLPRKNL